LVVLVFSIPEHDMGAPERFSYIGICFLAFCWLPAVWTAASQYGIIWFIQVWFFKPYELMSSNESELAAEGTEEQPRAADSGAPPETTFSPSGKTARMVQATSNDQEEEEVKLVAESPMEGFRIACAYHIGTLAMGSFLVSLFWMPRLMATGLWKVLSGLNKSPSCLDSLYKEKIQGVSSITYADVALTSADYWTAARDVIALKQEMKEEFNHCRDVVMVLNILIGVGTMTMLLIGLSAAVFTLPDFEKREHWPMIWFASVMCLSFPVAFMSPLGIAVKTLLYCLSLHLQRHEHKEVDLGGLAHDVFATARLGLTYLSYRIANESADRAAHLAIGGEDAAGNDMGTYLPKELAPLVVT
jgi:hypothetical protein